MHFKIHNVLRSSVQRTCAPEKSSSHSDGVRAALPANVAGRHSLRSVFPEATANATMDVRHTRRISGDFEGELRAAEVVCIIFIRLRRRCLGLCSLLRDYDTCKILRRAAAPTGYLR